MGFQCPGGIFFACDMNGANGAGFSAWYGNFCSNNVSQMVFLFFSCRCFCGLAKYGCSLGNNHWI